MTGTQLASFLGLSLVLAITPGPGVLYVVTRTLAQGREAGIASVLGIALGNLANGIASAVGLALLFRAVPAAYEIVRWAGAAYLLFLAIRSLREAPTPEIASTEPRAIVRDGFLVALLNPKTALFFAAFLPMFVDASSGALPMAGLAATFVVIAATTDAGYALFASALAPWLEGDRAKHILRRAPAIVYFGLAVLATAAPAP